MHDILHRRPGKRHLALGLALVVLMMLWAGWYTHSGERTMAAHACMKRALSAYRREGLKADAPTAPGSGRPARQVAQDLCNTDPAAF